MQLAGYTGPDISPDRERRGEITAQMVWAMRLQQDRGLTLTADEDECVADPTAGLLAGTPNSDEGALAMGRRIVSEEGMGVLWQGGLERVLRSAPQFGVTLALYEGLKQACAARGWPLV